MGFVSSGDGGGTWSEPETLAGPMSLSWLARTTSGGMVGDYISTSLVDTTAVSAFAVAAAKTGPVFDEAIHAARNPAGMALAQRARRSVTADPVLSTRSDHPAPMRPLVTP